MIISVHKSIHHDLYSLQVEGRRITLRNNLDRYGLTHVLRERLGKWYLPRSYCEWVHGWCWWQNDLEVQDLIYHRSTLPDSQWLLVTNELERSIAIANGIRRVVAAGLPIVYAVPATLPQRRRNTLLAFIDHSAEAEKDNGVADARFLDYLAELKGNYEIVAVSVFSLDYSDKIVSEVTRRGLFPIVGANPTDTRTFERICNYFSFFSEVTGNCMGSYIAYSLYLGAEVFLPGNFYKKDYSIFKSGNLGFSDEYISRIEYHYSENYARQNYKFLFEKNNNLSAQDRIDLGKMYVGEGHMLSNDELEFYLGWRKFTQVKEAVQGASRRINRCLKKALI